jgi:hypothetical protein
LCEEASATCAPQLRTAKCLASLRKASAQTDTCFLGLRLTTVQVGVTAVHGEPPNTRIATYADPPNSSGASAHLRRDANPRSAGRIRPPCACWCFSPRGKAPRVTKPLEGSREPSNSHELHPTRLSLSTSGATPQAAPTPGMGKEFLMNGFT